MRKPFILLMLLCILIPTISCTMAKEDSDMTYEMINMAEAREIFEKEGDYIILDVRTWEEYNDGHIPGAICIPNETIGTEEITQLPNKEQVIYIYCRSGNRSKQAAAKLVELGYTNIVEFGGMIDWSGPIER